MPIIINKQAILTLIIEQLKTDLTISEKALQIARETAVHSDCMGSSRYETMGLEASYLAQGQGTRLLEVERALTYFKQLIVVETVTTIGLSSLIELEDDQGDRQLLWLAADAGGLKIRYDNRPVTVITPRAPLGRALVGKEKGDEFECNINGQSRLYKILTTS
ncbi:MAG: GreA/GreB family elongation factor [Mariprofundus sp.]|nr:GreA/GreB family elongation factor [Mariprofundus sp.]